MTARIRTEFHTSFEPGQPRPYGAMAGCAEGGAVIDLAVGTGPTTSPTAATGVGYTGRHSLAVTGSAPDGGAAWRRFRPANVTVTADTELSYLIFPVRFDDLADPSTHLAVDLEFDDGTVLSELDVVDQHGAGPDPLAQGESRTLLTDQWNRKSYRLGPVAAGRVVTGMRVAYRNPRPAAEFAAFIDDITLTTHRQPAPDCPADRVLTTRGTHSSKDFSRGNNLPATALPHGFNFWTPITDARSLGWLYQYHRGNDADNRPRLQGLAISHQPSPWMGDRNTFQVMPAAVAGVPDADPVARSLAFGHENEIARPHHYRVRCDNGVTAEVAPTEHGAVLRFGFPGDDAVLVFDNVTGDGGLRLDPVSGSLSGYSDVASRLSVGARRMFVYAEFDRPVVDSGVPTGGAAPEVSGYLRFDAGPDRTVRMRVATSFIGIDAARHSLALEIGDADFDTVRDAAREVWNRRLSVVEVEGATEDQLTTLYSNLYRLFLYPNIGHENVGTAERPEYRHVSPVLPLDREHGPERTGAAVRDGQIYLNNGFWDTYRTAWPAYALLDPERAGAMIDGFLAQYREGGWVARWSSPGYADLMTGTSSDIAFADAYLKGVTGFDAAECHDAAVRNATVVPDDPGVGRKGLSTSVFTGRVDTDTQEGLSWALEGHLNDFGIAASARRLHDADPTGPRAAEYAAQHRYFADRARGYAAMFDPAVGFFQGRTPDGRPRLTPAEFDPLVWGHDYTETNAWNTAFSVPHDIPGLARLHGGVDALLAKLDTFFALPETADPANVGSYRGIIHEMPEARDVRMGQYGHSNQPSHHIPWLYACLGRPWRTQELTREVTRRLYLGSELGQGYCGDEDNGEMSAWWLFAALGFYPLEPGRSRYVVGSPLFRRAVVRWSDGRELVVNAPDNGPEHRYVRGLRVNGEPVDTPWLDHAVLAAGAVIDVDLTDRPTDWGTVLPSEPVPPAPLTDLAVAAEPAVLVDDSSVADVALSAGQSVVVELAEPRPVELYTVTSGAEPIDRLDWTWHGADVDGEWTELETRTGEAFRWPRQTRVFGFADSRPWARYRLTVGTSCRLSQLELLG